ncbi:MAG TPA: carboxylesterase family protein [Pseudomonadales bacterium]|nr:carboxylesterase family protein [Pseudomonadales bacterium]
MSPRLLPPTRLAALLALALTTALVGACAGKDSTPAPVVADPDTRVETREGPVTGFSDRHGALAWLGIPYARPPEGALRWRAPQPPQARREPLDALAFGPVCPQIGTPLGGAPAEVTGQLWGQEDCLFLNVHAPSTALAGDGGLPVMVWIHGGGNTVGHSGFYDGGPLAARHDLIVVTLNYRLGPLGWLRHPALAGDSADDASGNYGTLDLVRALHWVRANIDAFGGDPEKVTLFGESAGATNIASLLVSPRAAGLFRGAIMQSGGTASATAAEATHYRDDPLAPGARSSSGELLLRAISAGDDSCDRACARGRADAMSLAGQEALFRDLEVAELFALYENGMGLLGPDSPTVIRDGSVLPAEPFIDLLGTPGRYNAVPMMLGTNRDEPKIFMAFDPEQVRSIAGLPLWRRDARFYDLSAEYGALAWKVRGVDAPAARLHADGVPVWAYRWDWDEEGRLLFVDITGIVGAAHGLEIPFVFGHFDVGPQTSILYHDDNAPGRIALSDRMMAYWAAFARDLDPGRGADAAGPPWLSWDPEAGRTFVRLDTGTDGIRMDDTRVDVPALIERLAEDPRIENHAERCRIFAAAFRWDGSDEVAAGAERLDCPLPG